MDKKELYFKAITLYGERAQAGVAVEEMAELIKAICKYYNRSTENNKEKHKDEIAEEIADVEITLEQLKVIFAMDYKIDEIKKFKLQRLKEVVDK